MLIDAGTPPNVRVIDEQLLYPVYPSGVVEYEEAIVRYQHPNIPEPILKLADYICDYNGNCCKSNCRCKWKCYHNNLCNKN